MTAITNDSVKKLGFAPDGIGYSKPGWKLLYQTLGVFKGTYELRCDKYLHGYFGCMEILEEFFRKQRIGKQIGQ